MIIGALLAYAATFLQHERSYSLPADGILGNLVMGLSGLVCLVRAALVRHRRLPFILLGLTGCSWTIGNLIHIFHDQKLNPVPYPSLADVGYLSVYPLLIAAVVMMAHPELKEISLGSFLDGVLGGLSCAAAGSIIMVQPGLQGLGGSALTQLVGAAYPVLDLALVAMTVAVLTLKRGRPDSTWILIAAAIAIQAIADTIYLHQLARGTYAVGQWLDLLWPLGLALIGLSATMDDTPGENGLPKKKREQGPGQRRLLLLPNVFSVIAVGTLIFGSLSSERLPVYAVLLTAAALLTAVKRTAVGFNALTLLAVRERQAQTDELTQLSNRRHFDEQVQRILVERTDDAPVAVVMVDLNGFKLVNDTFGHHVGDEILRQVATRLRKVLRSGDLLARLGGDEFGLLLTDCSRETALIVGGRLADEVSRPMLIDGEVQSVGASVGIAVCPDDGLDMSTLLQRADAAMFDAKAHRQGATFYDPSATARRAG